MTAELRRTGSAVSFCAPSLPVLTTELVAEKLAQQRFRTIENAASEEASVGWVTPDDHTGNSFDPGEMTAGGAVWLRMRIDKKKLPSDVLDLHLAVARKARGRKLSKRERQELRDDLVEHMLPGIPPKTKLVDALLWTGAGEGKVILLSSSSVDRKEFTKLFDLTFGTVLSRETPAFIAAGTKLLPTPGWIVSDTDDPMGWLGQEFLTWFWWRTSTTRGTLDTVGDRRSVAIEIDDLLVLCAPDGDTEPTLRRGTPTLSSEAAAALGDGRCVSKARIIIGFGQAIWIVTLDGATFTMSSVDPPDDSEERESAADRNSDRASNWWDLSEIVNDLFRTFLVARTAGDWGEKDGAAITEWMRNGGAA